MIAHTNTLAASNPAGRVACSEPTEDLQRAILQAWQALQETPSDVGQQIARWRGFLELLLSSRSRGRKGYA